jgi:transposase-like protein
MNKSNKFSPEVRERAVRMVQEHRNPELRCARARRDEVLIPQIRRVWRHQKLAASPRCASESGSAGR